MTTFANLDEIMIMGADCAALRVHVRGVVQGVGFRPYVHRLANRHAVGGWVRNESGEVQLAIQGAPEALLAFLLDLPAEAPPLARIDSMEIETDSVTDTASFSILTSAERPDARQPVSPDVAMCPACEKELSDPEDRRYRYPFITCTDCGPRYTVIESMPYDRVRTSMRAFPQCDACAREYHDPDDRRYHSETNSCWACGPRVHLVTAGSHEPVACDGGALESAARLLRLGLIVAIRGLGGFHLAVDATSEAAVARLRHRKRRDAKPLAVMVRTVSDARAIAKVGPAEASLLTSRERPIVLLPRKQGSGLAPAVAPGLSAVGVMTAYTPLHHRLAELVDRPLVMTSGNLCEEPIAIANDDAAARLGNVADAFLLHDREIVSRYDDSVVRVVDDAPVFLRRARGFAPLPVPLPVATPLPLIAVGPHLKNTFTLAQGRDAYVSQHVGDLENLETLEHFRDTLDRYRRLFRIDPRVAVRDLHPGYLSTSIAQELGLERVIAVQHHHAHLAAVAAEHGVRESVVGVTYDGTGYGTDGCVWGGEILVGNLESFHRAAHLRYAPLPGGDVAARRPWRAALGYLSLQPDAWPAFARAFDRVALAERSLAQQQLEVGLNTPKASSMGRLFDAAAAVLGVRCVSRYEGQAAMELEALAGERAAKPLPFPIVQLEDGSIQLDPVPLLIALGERRARGEDLHLLAARFHESIAAATADVVMQIGYPKGYRSVVLGGGVFQNARLLRSTRRRLTDRGFRTMVPVQLSPNDGAISYGQAAVAAALLERER